MLGTCFRGYIFLPERCRSLAQHAAPVVAHLLQYLGVQAVDAEGFQFVESHIGRGDGVYLRIQHHTLHNLTALLLVSHAVDDGKHVGELGNLTVHHPVLDGVQIGFILVAPEGLVYLVAQLFCLDAIVALIDAQHFGTECHRFQRLAEQDLLEAQRAALVHGEVHPVNENPVVWLSFRHTVSISS